MPRAYLPKAIALALVTTWLVAAAPASAQEEEARILFEQGNQHLARGMRGPAARRERELGEAVDAYLGVLRLGARTRNVIFNLGLACEGLERTNDAFNYYAEYLRSFELSAEEREEGARRLAALRPQVAVLHIESVPEGAEVRLDRSDLPVRGRAPLDLAVPSGSHTVLLAHPGYRPSSVEATAAVGESTAVEVRMVAEPVPVQVLAPSTGRLTLDGDPIQPGTSMPVAPGTHVVRLDVEGAPPVERRFEVPPGADPMVIELRVAVSAVHGPHVAVHVDHEAEVFLDDVPIGAGLDVETLAVPGPHQVRVAAPGFVDAQRGFTLAPDDRLSLDVALTPLPDRTGIHVLRALLGVGSALGLSVAAGFALNVLALDAAWDRALQRNMNGEPGAETPEQLEARADELEAWSLATDVLFAATGALGIAAIIACVVDNDAPSSSIEVAGARLEIGGVAGPQQAMLVVRGDL